MCRAFRVVHFLSIIFGFKDVAPFKALLCSPLKAHNSFQSLLKSTAESTFRLSTDPLARKVRPKFCGVIEEGSAGKPHRETRIVEGALGIPRSSSRVQSPGSITLFQSPSRVSLSFPLSHISLAAQDHLCAPEGIVADSRCNLADLKLALAH